MLRRSMHHIKLPERKDLRYQLDFDADEREIYNAAKDKAIQCIEDSLQSRPGQGGYRNALNKIETMRQICNFGRFQHIDMADEEKLEYVAESQWSEDTASLALQQFPSLGLSTVCRGCGSSLDSGSVASDRPVEAFLSKCLRLMCCNCYKPHTFQLRYRQLCACRERCPVSKIQLEQPIIATTAGISCDGHNLPFPIKIRALLDDLKTVPPNTQR